MYRVSMGISKAEGLEEAHAVAYGREAIRMSTLLKEVPQVGRFIEPLTNA